MENIQVKVEQAIAGGQYTARYNGKVVILQGFTLPDEVVEASVIKERSDYIEACVERILEPSPERIDPPCEHFGICGGCSYQHIPYDIQIRIKREILTDCLRRIAGIDLEPVETLKNPEQWHYRLRAQFKVSIRGVGLHKKASREVVPLKKCLLMNQMINEYLQKMNDYLMKCRIREIHFTCGNTLIAQIIARKRALTDMDMEEIASTLLSAGLSGLNILRGDRKPVSFGRPYVELDLNGLRYTLSALSFIQNSWKLNQEMTSIIKRHIESAGMKRILDLYAGAGNLSLGLAQCADVTAVEGNPYAVKDGLRNVEINNISNYRIIRSSTEKFDTDERFDTVILDPPRPGISKRVIKLIQKIMPEIIVYVSCNPATLSRDIKRLSELYEIASIRLIDLFPHTHHIETLTFMRRRS